MMTWETRQKIPGQEVSGGNNNNNMMSNSNGGNGGFSVKVMTDEQVEVLRNQIAAYSTISQQLIHLHNSLTNSQQHHIPGLGLGTLYCEPSMTSASHQITVRQRWTPTPVQLQILERIFDQENGTPIKQKIKEITSELLQHGQISEPNVYNWFQNRRARSKRKQQITATNNAESEVETEVGSPNDKKTMQEDFQYQNNPASRAGDLYFQNMELSSGIHSMDQLSGKAEPPMFPYEGSSNPAGSLEEMSFESRLY